MMLRLGSFLFFLLAAFPLYSADVPLADLEQEKRAQHLFRDIRCMVCSGESLADSHASVASDMRVSIRKQIESGMEDDAIKMQLADKYGDVILMRPPFKSGTVVLWLGPWMILALGMVGVCFYFRKAKAKNESL